MQGLGSRARVLIHLVNACRCQLLSFLPPLHTRDHAGDRNAQDVASTLLQPLIQLRGRYLSIWFRCYVRGTETCPQHHGRSCFRGGETEDKAQPPTGLQFPPCQWQRSQALHPEGWRGNICRNSPGTKACLALLCVSLWCWIWGRGKWGCSEYKEAWEPAPGCSRRLGEG